MAETYTPASRTRNRPHRLWSRGFQPEAWARVIASGVDGFLVRESGLEARDLLEAVRWCQARAPGVELAVRGRLDVALAAGCTLHVPEAYPEPPAGLLDLSRPLHTPSQYEARSTAAQLLIAPIFPVPDKGPAWGIAGLHTFLNELTDPTPRLLTLGGVEPRNAASLRHPRLAGVALIRGLWDAADPARVVEALRSAWA